MDIKRVLSTVARHTAVMRVYDTLLARVKAEHAFACDAGNWAQAECVLARYERLSLRMRRVCHEQIAECEAF